MSFCSDVKSEICAIKPDRSCCRKALLNSAFAFFNTVNSSKIKMNTESAPAARYINMLIAEELNISADIGFKKSEQTKGYSLEITNKEDIKKIAEALGLLSAKLNQVSGIINDNLSLNPCCQRAVVIGAFLVSGSVTNPQKGYHFEISNHRKEPLHKLNEILTGMDFYSKIIKRGSDYVLYIKEKEVIADMLNLLGCKEMFFKYHDTIILKDKKNQLNRQFNCEQANLDKTVNAAVDQTMAIRNIIKYNKYDELPENLKEVAELRLENPEASLTELARLSRTSITRSGINHRLKKLVEIGTGCVPNSISQK